jgi:hypothetical protein
MRCVRTAWSRCLAHRIHRPDRAHRYPPARKHRAENLRVLSELKDSVGFKFSSLGPFWWRISSSVFELVFNNHQIPMVQFEI